MEQPIYVKMQAKCFPNLEIKYAEFLELKTIYGLRSWHTG